jgi:hypothetical protein
VTYPYGTLKHPSYLRNRGATPKVNVWCGDPLRWVRTEEWVGDLTSPYFTRPSCNHCERETTMWPFSSKKEGHRTASHTAAFSWRIIIVGLVVGGVPIVWPPNSQHLRFLCGIGYEQCVTSAIHRYRRPKGKNWRSGDANDVTIEQCDVWQLLCYMFNSPQ